MHALDWLVVGLFFLGMVAIGLYSKRKSSDSGDFFVGGGKVPWWLAGVSHHVSGHSSVVFVAYAGIAYTLGFTIFVWWALVITVATLIGARLIAPRWPRLRQRLGVQSPTEYLLTRYGLPAQQLIAVMGVLMKLLDIGAKWASIGILMNGFTGIPVWLGIALAGVVSMVYVTIGGLWADLITDFVQFGVQLVAGIVIAFGVAGALSERGLSYLSMWGPLNDVQPGFSDPFSGEYTMLWASLYLFVKTFEYNGGNWNLAARFIATAEGRDARKASLLSSLLYLVWPLLVFAPMWAGRLLFPNMDDPAAQLYPTLSQTYLPAGLVGLVIAAMFASTMGMTVSDINTLSAVSQRDILPVVSAKFRAIKESGVGSLRSARLLTVFFTVVTVLVGMNADSFGGVLGLVIPWFGALVGITGVPLVLGLFSTFRHTDGAWTILSVGTGTLAFVLIQTTELVPADLSVALPLIVTAATYVAGGLVNRARHKPVAPEIQEMLDYVATDNGPALQEHHVDGGAEFSNRA
ncbi:MAG: sodium:solute symporter family protein [Nocardioides sp.]|uniref:sodium:solute symporter family protein n=1 Tax=Nocardioides sp. TaxID=35761 RepID=UPI003D6C032B